MVLGIGRVCVKIAGRDAGKKCVIVKEIDNTYVLVDGQTRRRKVNKFHLEPLEIVLSIDEDADNTTVVAAMTEAGFESVEKKSEKREQTIRPKRQKAAKVKEAKPEKKAKKAPAEKKEKKAKKVESEGDEE